MKPPGMCGNPELVVSVQPSDPTELPVQDAAGVAHRGQPWPKHDGNRMIDGTLAPYRGFPSGCSSDPDKGAAAE